MTAAEWLARARAVTDGATSGPWKHNGVNGVHTLIGSCVATTHIYEDQRKWEDAAFIAASRTMLPAAVAAIEAVLDVHRPVWCDAHDVYMCVHCGHHLTVASPDCPTVRAITAHLDGLS